MRAHACMHACTAADQERACPVQPAALHGAAATRLSPVRTHPQMPSIWQPLQLVGATAGAAIAFILPGLLALSLAGWRVCSGGGAASLLLILLGALLAAAGIAGAAKP